MTDRFSIPIRLVAAALLVHAATGPTAYAQLDEPPSTAPVWHGQPMDQTIEPGESIAQRIPNSEERLRSATAYIGQHPDISNSMPDGTLLNIGSNVQFLPGQIFETTSYWLRICNDLGCTDSDAFTITVEEEQAAPGAPAPFQEASELGEGWWFSEWFSSFNINFFPWIFHAEHVWMFVSETSTPESVFLFDLGAGSWLFTSATTYPNLYSFGRSSWIFYFAGSSGPRQFVDLGTGEFFSLN